MKGVSIVICCYNSELLLYDTLSHLAKQIISREFPVEVIIVDNASSDNTSSRAWGIWVELGQPFSMKVCYENKPGIAYARQQGVLNSSYSYVIFCDDDNWLSPNYSKLVFDIFKNQESVGIIGARSTAVSEVEFPFWFSTFQSSYAVGVQGLSSGDISNRGFVWGAGLAIRKSLYLSLLAAGFKPILVGRTGDKKLAGDDYEICQWVILVGYTLYYSEDLVFQHWIPKERLTKEYLARLNEGFVKMENSIKIYHLFAKKDHYKWFIFRYFIYLYRFLVNSDSQLGGYLEFYNPFSLYCFDHDVRRIRKALKLYEKYNK